MVASVESMLPATPRLLAWMCSGCGTPSSDSARASVCTTWRGVTCQCTWSSSTSSFLWLNLKAEMPPGFTTFTPIALLAPIDQPT